MPACLLALEISCDETAAAVCSLDGSMLSSRLFSQIEIHRVYGGVVPEVSSRSHTTKLKPLVEAVLDEGGVTLARSGIGQ